MLSCCENISILWGVGTHGSLGGYSYEVSKDSLETAIESLIKHENKIVRLENDRTDYIDVLIKSDNPRVFVFRFAGDKEYWNSHPNESHIFIAYTKKEGKELFKSEGEISRKEKKEAVKVFEEYFIKELEKQTGLKPKKK